jgi:hypothetical protein
MKKRTIARSREPQIIGNLLKLSTDNLKKLLNLRASFDFRPLDAKT